MSGLNRCLNPLAGVHKRAQISIYKLVESVLAVA